MNADSKKEEKVMTKEEKDFILAILGLEPGETFSFEGQSYFVDDKGHVYQIIKPDGDGIVGGERLENADTALWKLLHHREELVKERIQQEDRIKLFYLLNARFGCTGIIREGDLLCAGINAAEDAAVPQPMICGTRKARRGLQLLLDSDPNDRAAAISTLIRTTHKGSKMVLLLSPEQLAQGAYGLKDGVEMDIREEIERKKQE